MPSTKKKREEEIRKLISREYRIFREEERETSLPRTLYEKMCNSAARILHVNPDKKSREKMQVAMDFAHLKTTPEGVMSFTILFMLITFIPLVAIMATGMLAASAQSSESTLPDWVKGLPGIPVGIGAMFLLLVIFFTYYLYLYPYQVKRKYEATIGSDIVTMILYMVLYMRNTPNLEGAVKFAAENLSGDIGYELKKMLWDVEVGNYLSMEEALTDYTKKWEKNRPFVEAVQLMVSSLRQAGERRESLLDESMDVVLEGTRDDARNFNQKLKLPVVVVHAIGIILPVMGLVLFPIVAVFLKVETLVLFLGYDVILPIILYFIIISILERRPATFSKIDISENPDVPPPGKFRAGKKFVKAWPVALAVGLSIIAFGLFLYLQELSAAEAAGEPGLFEGIVPAVVITSGIAIGLAVYFILISSQLLKVREKTRQIEGEFAEALFQIGNQTGGGVPLELSIEKSM
ncbi:MAG: type II secretion system F family protein, partial [Candidatus Aenigmarchaeota archaeon]|nr:type II secretion system F family protein [Candidatus Aenigmarchaeota archaeon]